MSKDIETYTSSTGKNTGGQLTLFPEGFPASRSVRPGSDKARKIIAGSGLRCLESLERLGRGGLLAKMLLASSRWRMAGHLKGYYLAWKMKGTRYNRILFRLAVSGRGTGETGYGLLPTKTATGSAQTKENPTPGQTGGTTLKGYAKMFPTPDCSDRRSMKSKQQGLSNVVKLFPTPTTRDHKDTGNLENVPENALLGRYVRNRSEKPGNLNPRWVGWLQGYPDGWTDLKP